jgi:hypothetical protein
MIRQLSFLCLIALLACPAAASAQRNKKLVDTVIDNNAKTLEKLGLSYGPFIFAHSNTDQVTEEMLMDGEVLWLQTPHFRIGSTLKKWKIPVAERKNYRAELTEMQLDYPDIDPKVTTLDRWYRIHLYAWRMEKLYAEFLQHMGWTDADFRKLPPEELLKKAFADEFTKTINDFELARGGQVRSKGFPQWVGMGQYLGEPFRFEIFLCQDQAIWQEFKLLYFGIRTGQPQRWNMKVDTVDGSITQARSRCLLFGISAQQAHIRHDQHMHNALRHNMAINFLDAYMLYLFDLPAWVREGYAHYMRRLNRKGYSFFDSGEGAAAIENNAEEWAPLVRKLVKKDKAADFALLSRLNDYVDLDFNAHLVVWSKVDFLINIEPGKFGQFITQIKTQTSGAGMATAQRKAFKDVYGWTMHQAEETWKAWVLENYTTK